MERKFHDIHSKGFCVSPEKLAHDLAILKLSKSPELTSQTNEWKYYDAYIEQFHSFLAIVDDKTRYDSTVIK